MIFNNKLLQLTDDEQLVLLYAVNTSTTTQIEYNINDIKSFKLNCLSQVLSKSKSIIKPEHIGMIESIQQKLL